MYPCAVPNDEIYAAGGQWGLSGYYGINAPKIWDVTKGVDSVLVGVIDSGIDATHEDLKNRVNASLSRDFSGSSGGALSDTSSHGTHVAGIIGAEGNNALGLAGVNWNVQLVSLKISDYATSQNPTVSGIISAVKYATSAGIPILNNSNGSSEYTGSSVALETALSQYSGLFVTSAGNEERNNDTNPNRFPSNIILPNVICVGGIKANGERYYYSNYGINTVDIYAPGEDIISTTPVQRCHDICARDDATLTEDERQYKAGHDSDGYHSKNGTSMAAPHVAGGAGVLLSKDSTLKGGQLRRKIL